MLLTPSISLEELKKVSHAFCEEIQHAYARLPSSLSFLMHKLPPIHPIEDGAIIQVMVFGGTIFKTALFQKKAGQFIQIGDDVENQTPLFIDKSTFVHFARKELIENIQYLSVNFAYPITPVLSNGLLDGILLRGTKEHQFTGLIGECIGKTIQEEIMRDIKAPIHITVANDAVCLLLSEANTANWVEIVGGIVGTGTNYAITLPDKTVVNLESGNFHALPLSDSGKYIDEESKDKGRQLIEKEISGAYLFKHYNYYIKRESIDAPLLTSTTQLSEIAENSAHIGSKIAQLILGRSAALTAAQIAGIFLFKTHCTGIARNAPNLAHLTFVMEGNLFWHGWKYKENVERNLDALGLHDNISFTQNEHHSIKGALHLLKGL